MWDSLSLPYSTYTAPAINLAADDDDGSGPKNVLECSSGAWSQKSSYFYIWSQSHISSGPDEDSLSY